MKWILQRAFRTTARRHLPPLAPARIRITAASWRFSAASGILIVLAAFGIALSDALPANAVTTGENVEFSGTAGSVDGCNPRLATDCSYNVAATENVEFSGALGSVDGCEPDAGDCGYNVAATIDWGDQTSSPADVAEICRAVGPPRDKTVVCSFQVSGRHTYAEGGQYPVSVEWTDDQKPSQEGMFTTQAVVVDAALHGSPTSTVGYQFAPSPAAGAPVALFADDNSASAPGEFAATIDWGDGSPSGSGTVIAASGGGYEVHGAHAYSITGLVKVTVTVNDAGGSTTGLIISTLQILPRVPATSVTLTPSVPTGSNGWYRSKVHVVVAASESNAVVVETRCVLDPRTSPGSFDAMPSAPCGFLGAGADVAANGAHTLYAASINDAGIASTPVPMSIKIDTTRPTVRCPMPHPVVRIDTRGAVVTARVADGQSGPASAVVATLAVLSSAGRKTAHLKGFDNAGNSATARCPYTVLPAILQPMPLLTWSALATRTYTTMSTLTVSNVPRGAKVTLTCIGHGCPFRVDSVSGGSPSQCRRASCGRHYRRQAGRLDFTALLRGRHLAVGTRVEVRIIKRNTIGKVWLFRIRPGAQPDFKGGCLAPGSRVPNRGC